MNEPWKQNVKLKGQIPENYILNECIFIKLKKYKSVYCFSTYTFVIKLKKKKQWNDQH